MSKLAPDNPVRDYEDIDRDYEETEALKQDAMRVFQTLRPKADKGILTPTERIHFKNANHDYNLLQAAQDDLLKGRPDYHQYRQSKYAKPTEVPEESGTTWGDVGNQIKAGAGSLAAGVPKALSLPERIVESAKENIPSPVRMLLGGERGKYTGPLEGAERKPMSRVYDTAHGMASRAHKEAGNDPNGVGPQVLESVGEGATLGGPGLVKSGLQNFLRQGAASAGLYTADTAAEGEAPTIGGAAKSFVGGGALGVILGKVAPYLRGVFNKGEKPTVPPDNTSSTKLLTHDPNGVIRAGEGPGWSAPPPPNYPGPRRLEGPTTPVAERPMLEDQRQPVIHQPGPPRELPSPELPATPVTIDKSPIRRILNPDRDSNFIGPRMARNEPPSVPEQYRTESVNGVNPDVARTSSGDQSKVMKLLSPEPEPDLVMPTSTVKPTEAPRPVSPVAKILYPEKAPEPPVMEPTAVKEAPIDTERPARVDKLIAERQAKPMVAPTTPVKEVNPVAAETAKVDKGIQDTVNLKDILSGKTEVKSIKAKKDTKRVPKAEAPAPTVEGEVGANVRGGNFATSKPAERKLPLTKSEKEMASGKPIQLENFIKEKGWSVRKIDDPIEPLYEIKDAKGNVRARGTRDTVVNAVQQTPDSKGFVLGSGLGGAQDIAKKFAENMRKLGGSYEDITRNGPQRSSAVNAMLRNAETTRFGTRHNPAMQAIADEGIEATRKVGRRYRDFYMRNVGGKFEPTDYHHYQSLPQESKDRLQKILVVGDKIEKEFSPAELAKAGLSQDEIRGYKGVREALSQARIAAKGELLEKMKREKSTLTKGELDSLMGDIPGYIPRTWGGKWEVFANGAKHIKPNESSSFDTEYEALHAAHELKTKDPAASVEIKHFANTDYERGMSPLGEARLLNTLRKNLEATGSIDSKTIDEAFRLKRDVKGFKRHVLERKNAEGYDIQNIDKVIDRYIEQNAKFVEMSRFKRAAAETLEQSKTSMSEEQYKWIENHVERVVGKPAFDDMKVQSFIRSTALGKWMDPTAGGRFLNNTRQLMTHMSLGMFNPGYAAINLGVVAQHVWPALAREAKGMGILASDKYLLGAIKDVSQAMAPLAKWNPTTRALMQRMAHEGVIDIQMMSEHIPDPRHLHVGGKITPSQVSMLLGTLTEEWSRGVAAIAHYRMSIDKGLSDQAAMKAAHLFVGDTIGDYSVAGKPKLYSGPVGGLVGQFKTFMSVMLENGYMAMRHPINDPGVTARYLIANIGLAGLMGAPFASDMDEFITKHWGFSPFEQISKLPRGISRGLASVAPGWVGLPDYNVDLSGRAGMGDIVPNDVKSAFGPAINRGYKLIADVINGEADDFVYDLLPNSVRSIVDAYRGHSEDRHGRTVYKYSEGERIVKGLGLPPVGETEARTQYSVNANKAEYLKEEKSRQLDKAMEGSKEAAQRYRELGGSSKTLYKRARDNNKSALERQQKTLPKILRNQNTIAQP